MNFMIQIKEIVKNQQQNVLILIYIGVQKKKNVLKRKNVKKKKNISIYIYKNVRERKNVNQINILMKTIQNV